jgi:membrane-associated phospholipid phosphatase
LTFLAQTRRSCWQILGCTLLAVCPATSQAASDIEPDFYSLREWAPVYTWEYFAIPAANAATLTISLTIHPPPRWRGGILFDNWARNGLRLNSEAARTHAGTASTVLAIAVGFFPPLIDAGLLTGWIHQRRDLAWQMFVLDAEVLTLTGLVTTATTHLVGRERPSGLRENDSFFSGHAAIGASAATLICLQHLQLGLFGNKAADGITCGAAAAAAVSNGFLRMMADRHYASDVIVGTAVGVGSAFLVYNLKVRPARAEQASLQVIPVLRSDFLGLSFAGDF